MTKALWNPPFSAFSADEPFKTHTVDSTAILPTSPLSLLILHFGSSSLFKRHWRWLDSAAPWRPSRLRSPSRPCPRSGSWSPNSTYLHLDFYLSTYTEKRHSRVICPRLGDISTTDILPTWSQVLARVPDVISAPTIIDYSNSTLSGLYRVAVLVLSAPKNREKRQNIRKLRLPGCHLQVSCKLQKNNWSWTPQFLFLIGQTGSSSIEENLQEVSKRSLVLQKIVQHEMIWRVNFQERETHDDILRLSVKESYWTLPRQEKKFWSWWLSVFPNILSSAQEDAGWVQFRR